MWVVGGVCPHCFAPVMMLARFLATHRSWHYKQALQIIRYLYINRDVLVIRYTRQEDPTLNNTIFGFVDADWSSGYSRGGYVFMMNGGPIDWVSRLFRCTAQSSTEAEYMALCDCVNASCRCTRLRVLTTRLSCARGSRITMQEASRVRRRRSMRLARALTTLGAIDL